MKPSRAELTAVCMTDELHDVPFTSPLILACVVVSKTIDRGALEILRIVRTVFNFYLQNLLKYC